VSRGILLIVDGWGYAPPGPGNAIAAAHTPVLDDLSARYPVPLLAASGRAVGLPDGVVGNSEIGHLVIGAGRPLDYDSLLVWREADSGRLRAHRVLVGTCERLRRSGGALHLVGLASDGRIHSDIAHLGELLYGAANAGLSRILVHAITDGRDVANGTAGAYLGQLQRMLGAVGVGRIASVVGRNYAMDKSGQQSLTNAACELILDGAAEQRTDDAVSAASGHAITDDGWLPPVVVDGPDWSPGPIRDGDAVLFANFRSDRTAPLADMMADRLNETNRQRVELLSLTVYDTKRPIQALVPRADAAGGLADALDAAGIRSARIAEREKFEHVTFFINGRDPTRRPLEEHLCVPGGPEGDYTLAPAMNVIEVAHSVIEASRRPEIGLTVANLANMDVVGHTGQYKATVTAAEAVDTAIGRVADAARQLGRWLVIVGDHGNAEQMIKIDADGAERPYGGHTTSTVPAILVSVGDRAPTPRAQGTLADIAPTVLALLDVPASPAMTGRPLI